MTTIPVGKLPSWNGSVLSSALPDVFPDITTDDPLLAVPALVQQAAFLAKGAPGGGQSTRITQPMNSPQAVGWEFYRGVWFQNDAYGAELWIPLNTPARGSIQQVIVYMRGDRVNTNAHGANAPVGRPLASLYEQVFANVDITQLAFVYEATVGGAAYDAAHAFTLAFDDVNIASNAAYYVRISGESGTHALVGSLGIFGIAVDYGRPIP